jgi:hypothetical protein
LFLFLAFQQLIDLHEILVYHNLPNQQQAIQYNKKNPPQKKAKKKYTSLYPSLLKSSKASDETLSPVTVHNASSLFLLKPCIEQLPPTIANCSGNSPQLPMVIACAPSGFYKKKL